MAEGFMIAAIASLLAAALERADGAGDGAMAGVHAARRRLAAPSLLGLMMLIGGAATAPAEGFAPYGRGKADCKRFLEVRRAGGRLELSLRQWVFSFVSP